DRIREEMGHTRDIREAAIKAVSTTGNAVTFTALTLIAGVVMWIFMSDLKFQSDAALLLSFMLVVNAIAAVLIVPTWCITFKPRFVMGEAPTKPSGSGVDPDPEPVTRAQPTSLKSLQGAAGLSR